MNKFFKRAAGFSVVGFASAAVSAQAAIDTAPITTALTEAGAAAAVAGAAYLVVIVGIKAFKLIRQAL